MDEWWKSSPTVDDDSWYKSSPVIEAAHPKKLPVVNAQGKSTYLPSEGVGTPQPKPFNPVQNGRQFSLGGRGSETQEPPPDIMQVGPMKHVMDRTGTSTNIPGKLRPSSEPLETTTAKMKGAKGVAARAGLGFVKGIGFGSQPTPEDIAMKLSMPLLGGMGPVASTALGETFQAPETINAIRNRDWEALAASLGIGAIPGIAHGVAKGVSALRRPAKIASEQMPSPTPAPEAVPVSPGEGQAPLLKGKTNASKIQSPTAVGEQSVGQESVRGSGSEGVGPSLQGTEVTGKGQAQKEVTPKTLEQIVDEHDWVTSAPRAKQMLTAAQDISDRLDAGEKLSTKAAGGLGVKHGIPAEDMASLYKDIKASRVEPTSPLPEAPIKPLGTLQSSIVPGAEEFIKQDVGPAFEATKAAPGRIRQALGAIFNPPGIDEAAGQTARIIRGQGGEMARQTELAHSVLNDAKNYFRKALIARPPETSKGVAYSHPAIQFMDAVENGRPTGNAGLDATAQAIREGFDKRAAEAQKLGILNETIEDYFPHIWKKPGLTENIKAWIGGRRPFAGPESFRKQRSIPTISEGLQQGLKPVSWNPIELSLLKMREMDRSLMAHKAFNEMKEQGLAKFVRFGNDVPEGYRKLDDKIARVLERQETTKVSGDPGAPQFVMRGNYYAPEAAARVFNNYLSPGLRGNPLFDIAHGTSNVLNQAQLGLSAFHLMFVGIDADTAKLALGLQKVSEGKLASGGLDLGKTAIPLYAPLETYFKGSKGIKAYFDPKLAEGNPLFKEIDALQKAGGRVKMDSFYRNSSVESFWNALESHNYPGAVLRAPFALLQQSAKPIMEHVVPRMKMGVFMDMAQYELSKLPKDATLDMQRKVLQDSWDSVDNRMGQLVYDNLFWNRALKDAGLAGVRSLGWNLGTIRELGGGVKDVLGTPSRMKEGGPLLSRRMAYTMALPMRVALTGSIIYYLANGKPPPTLRDAFQPTINGERMQPASYMKDIVPLGVSYQQEGVQGLLDRGKKMAQSKVNPGLATLIEMMNNEDYFGNKIRNDDAPLVDRAMQEVNYAVKQFQPFSLRDNPYRPNAPGSEKAMQFFGITRVPRDRTQAEEKHMNAIRELMQERSSSPFGKGLGGANMKSLLK